MKAELAAIESIRRGYKGKPLVKNVKKLPPLIGNKKKPSSAKKAEAKAASTKGGRAKVFYDGIEYDAAKYKADIEAGRKALGTDIQPPPVKLD